MRHKDRMHPAQSSVLYTLRHRPQARYAELQKATGLESDAFKFHLRRLQEVRLVEKRTDGSYALTATGKEYANRFDEAKGYELAQPKVSQLLYVTTLHGGIEYLLAHKRLRQPFYEYWGIASAPVAWGVSLGESARQELLKQAGITADFSVHGHLRVMDRRQDGTLLEDKLFLIMVAELPTLQPPEPWHGGEFAWLTPGELAEKTPLFPTTQQTIDMIRGGVQFAESTCTYSDEEY